MGTLKVKMEWTELGGGVQHNDKSGLEHSALSRLQKWYPAKFFKKVEVSEETQASVRYITFAVTADKDFLTPEVRKALKSNSDRKS